MDEGIPLSQAMGSRGPASDGVPLSQMMGQPQDQGVKLSQVAGTPFVSVPGFGAATAPLNLSDPSTVVGEATPTESAALDMTLGQTANALRAAGETTTMPLQPLALPLRAAAGLAARAVDLAVPGAKDKLIGKLPAQPKLSDYAAQVVPNITFLDIGDFLAGSHLGSPQDYVQQKVKEGTDPATAYNQYQWLKEGAQGAGIVADFVLDPLRFAAFGQLNEVAQAAREQGKFMAAEDVIAEHASRGVQLDPIKLEDRIKIIEGLGQYPENGRNALDVRIPFTEKKVSVALPERVQEASAPEVARKFVDALDYRFGVPELDHAAVENYFDKTAAVHNIKGGFLSEMAKLDFNPDEQQAIARLVEATPNLLPENIPAQKTIQKVTTSYENRAGELVPITETSQVQQNVGRGLGVYNEEFLGRQMARKLPELTADLKDVSPERADQMIQAAMRIKKANADINGMQYASGLIHDDNMADTIMKRYYAHVPTPEGVKAAKLAARGQMAAQDAVQVEENAVSKQLNRALGPSKLSSFNNNRLVRSVQLPIEEAEAVMSKQYGVDRFYVENPFIATAVRWAQSEKTVADKKFLDSLVKYGITPASREQELLLKNRGWGPLNVSEFMGKTLTMNVDGIPTSMKLQDHLFPPNIVSKVGYWIKPGEIGNFEGFIRSYNKVFKTMALLTPGFHVRNTMEDIFKYYASGGTLKGFTTGAVTTLLPILPRSVAAQTVELGGSKFTYGKLAEMVQGLKGSSDSQLNLAEHLFAGKTLFQKLGEMANPVQMAKNVVRTFNEIGEGGIHFMRNSTYLDMRDRGWSHSAALFQTQHLMFDFRRATPVIDKMRSFWDPFIQHAIKTAFITPELMGKSPQAYNLLLNNMPKYLSWAMSDPVKDQYLQLLAPDYLKYRDPVASPLLPGDSLMASIFQPPQQGKWASFVTPDLGPGILKKFQVWDAQVIKNRMGFGPAINSLATFFTGIDTTGKPVDADPNRPELMARAARAFLDGAGAAAFGTPGVWRAIKDQAGIGQPNVLPSTNMRLAQAMFGQFIHFENVQKDYMIKSLALAGAYGDLQKQLPGALAKEASGRDFSVALANYPKIVQDLYAKAYPNSANSIWQRYVDTTGDFLRAKAGMEGLSGQKTASQILGEMKTIKMTVDRLNDVHSTMTRALLENASKARTAKTSTQ